MSSSGDEGDLPPVEDEQLQQMFANAGLVITAEEEVERRVGALLESPLDAKRGQEFVAFLDSPQVAQARLAQAKLTEGML